MPNSRDHAGCCDCGRPPRQNRPTTASGAGVVVDRRKGDDEDEQQAAALSNNGGRASNNSGEKRANIASIESSSRRTMTPFKELRIVETKSRLELLEARDDADESTALLQQGGGPTMRRRTQTAPSIVPERERALVPYSSSSSSTNAGNKRNVAGVYGLDATVLLRRPTSLSPTPNDGRLRQSSSPPPPPPPPPPPLPPPQSWHQHHYATRPPPRKAASPAFVPMGERSQQNQQQLHNLMQHQRSLSPPTVGFSVWRAVPSSTVTTSTVCYPTAIGPSLAFSTHARKFQPPSTSLVSGAGSTLTRNASVAAYATSAEYSAAVASANCGDHHNFGRPSAGSSFISCPTSPALLQHAIDGQSEIRQQNWDQLQQQYVDEASGASFYVPSGRPSSPTPALYGAEYIPMTAVAAPSGRDTPETVAMEALDFGTPSQLRQQAAMQRFVVTPVPQIGQPSSVLRSPGPGPAPTISTHPAAMSGAQAAQTVYYPFEESHPLSTNSITLGSTDGRRIDVRKVLDPMTYDQVVYSSLQRGYAGEDLGDLHEDDDEDDDLPDGFDGKHGRAPRQKWSSKLEFVLACIGYAVGLGNVWRFPYLAYKSGGGAFLVPYVVMLLVCGVPLMYMEFAVGQYTRRGPIQALDRLCPFFKGAGFGTVVISFLLCTYYNVIIAWALFYLFNSFRSRLPWSHCNNTYNSVWCVDTNESEEKFAVASDDGDIDVHDEYAYNSTKFGIERRFVNCTSIARNNWTIHATGNGSAGVLESLDENDSLNHLAYPRTPSEDFFFEGVLRISSGIDDPQAMRWELVLSLFVAWVLVYFSIWKSVKSSGKVVYFTALFPYLVMIVFLVSALNLPGARDGVMYLIRPNWDFLWDADVWIHAASQIFNSIGIGFGSLIAFASYNQYQNSIIKDTMTVASVNALTSVLAGIIVFATLGNLSHEQGKCIDDIVSDGPGLVFVVYPQALNKMPLPTLWATLFFFMLLCLGLDSQFAMVEVVVTSLTDAYSKKIKKWLKKHEFLVLVVCLLSFLFGLPNVTEGGIYFFQLIDHYAASISIMYITFFEVIAVCWFYGAGRLARNCLEMTGELPSLYFQLCWWFASPLLIAIIWVYSLYESQSVTYNNDRYKYPHWAEYCGWLIAGVSIAPIPIQAAIAVYNAAGNTFKEKLMESLQSRIKVCPTCGSDLLCKTGRMRIGKTSSEDGCSPRANKRRSINSGVHPGAPVATYAINGIPYSGHSSSAASSLSRRKAVNTPVSTPLKRRARLEDTEGSMTEAQQPRCRNECIEKGTATPAAAEVQIEKQDLELLPKNNGVQHDTLGEVGEPEGKPKEPSASSLSRRHSGEVQAGTASKDELHLLNALNSSSHAEEPAQIPDSN